MARPRKEDPRGFRLLIRVNRAEIELLMASKPEDLTRTEWVRRMLLLAANAARIHAPIREKLTKWV